MFNKRTRETRPVVKEDEEKVKNIIKEVPKEDEYATQIKALLEASIDPYSPIGASIPFDSEDIILRNIDFSIPGAHVDMRVDAFKEIADKDFNFAYQFSADRMNIFTYMLSDYIESVMINSCMSMVMPLNMIVDETGYTILNCINFLKHIRSEDNRNYIERLISEYLSAMDITATIDFPDDSLNVDLQAEEVELITDNLMMILHRIVFNSINNALDEFVFGSEYIDEVNYLARHINDSKYKGIEIGQWSQQIVKDWIMENFFLEALSQFEIWLLTVFREQFRMVMIKCSESSFYTWYVKHHMDKKSGKVCRF